MAARTDIHREGAFIPADYTYEFSFSLASQEDGWPIPAINIDLVVELRGRGAVFGPVDHPSNATNVCSVCGAWFKHGDVWKHVDGEYVTLGHICADKFELAADRREFRQLRGSVISRAISAEKRKARKVEWIGKARELLAAEPGINADLKTKHYIVEDIRARVLEWGNLTPPQVALVRKLAFEATQPAEPKAPVPVTDKRIVIEGEVVSEKWHEPEYSPYPGRMVMTVKVQNGAGSWLCWGSVPSDLSGEGRRHGEEVLEAARIANNERVEALTPWELEAELKDHTTPLLPAYDPTIKGATVRFTARVEPSDTDESFGFFKRPTKAEIVSWPAEEK